MTYGSVRHHTMLAASASQVWELVGAPERLAEWFPGITACRVNGTERIVTLGTGLEMPERIVTNDVAQRRFQYEITSPLFRSHRATIDVIELTADSCLVSYQTDADPRTMALTIAGATAGALAELRRVVEGSSGADTDVESNGAVDGAESDGASDGAAASGAASRPPDGVEVA